jgi:hypothetical protein
MRAVVTQPSNDLGDAIGGAADGRHRDRFGAADVSQGSALLDLGVRILRRHTRTDHVRATNSSLVAQPGSAVGAGGAVTSGEAFVVSGVVGTSFFDVDGPPLGGASAGPLVPVSAGGAVVEDVAGAAGEVVAGAVEDGGVELSEGLSSPLELHAVASSPSAATADTAARIGVLGLTRVGFTSAPIIECVARLMAESHPPQTAHRLS